MSACKYCLALIGWNRVSGKWLPTNADGSPHLCKSPKVHIHDVNHRVGKTIIGAHYTPSCGCGVPPWERCACSFAGVRV